MNIAARTLLTAAALSLAALSPAQAQGQETPAAAPSMADQRDWSAALRQDATALHDIISDSHPGMHDPLNPGFRANVEEGLALALRRAETTTDAGGWWWALRAYVASFNDGHVQMGLKDGAFGFPTRWPGFLTVYRGGDQVVADRQEGDPAAPPLGARLVDCDGVGAETLAEQRIGQFRGRWFLEAQHAQLGDWMFMNASNPWITEMRECRFESDGRMRSYALNWRAIEAADLSARRTRLAQRAFPEFGFKTMDDGGLWLSMPSFNGQPGSEAYTALTAILEEARTRQDALRTAPFVVLDVRGNGGGSSHWSGDLATLMWGIGWRLAHNPPSSDAVEWRASDANIDVIAGFVDELKTANGSPELIAWGEQAVAGMRAARDAGQVYWRWEPETNPEDAAAEAELIAAAKTNPMQGRVFILTDSACGSACLDAVDSWKAAGAVQIGRETTADTVYMEVRGADLPSGLAQIGVPMKVYRGRARGNNEPHRPAHVFDGDMTDDAALLAWVRTLAAGQP